MNIDLVGLLTNPYLPRVLAGILGATLVFFAIISAVLIYHWKRYEQVKSGTIFITFVYFAVSAILLGGATRYLFLFTK